VLALTLGGDEGTDGAKGGSGDKTVAGATPSADTKGDEGDKGGDAQPDGSADGAGGGSGSGAGDNAPSANQDEDDTDGDTDGSGSGADVSTGAAGDRFTGPGGQKLLIAWTSTPKSDPVADWKSQERFMRRAQYRQIRIEKVDYRGWNAADWEFTYTEGGTKYRTIDRGFVVEGRVGYALMYTAKAADWDGEQRKTTWRTLTETFQPKS